MAVRVLEEMCWPDIEAAIAAGHDTVVVAFGATVQHGPHMPVSTDSLIGDHLARAVADHYGAFMAPTVRLGCSGHHLAFGGTLAISEPTFQALVADLVGAFVRNGFRRIVLLPTHSGNFAPLAAATARLKLPDDVSVFALTDIELLIEIAMLGLQKLGVQMPESGLHAGEFETSMLLAVRPELVRTDCLEPGYTEDAALALQGLFGDALREIAPNGVIGDPARASAEHGHEYWATTLRLVLAAIDAPVDST